MDDIPVRILDAPALHMTVDEVVHDVVAHQDGIVGITMLTPAFAIVSRLCDALKHAIPNCLILIGGAHASALPERTLEEIPAADIVCIGEGEFTTAEVVQNWMNQTMDWAEVDGICYRENDRIHRNKPRPPIRDLDLIPPPARHLLPMQNYHLTASRVSGESYCPTIIVARGCPFACTYCSRTFGRTFRAHTIDRIISEIRSLIDTYDVSQINIEADTLTVNKKFITALCNALIETKISQKIKWTCESRVDTVNEDILRLMKRAGCWQISYGVETGSQRLLDSINKSVSLRQIEEVFSLTKRVGISIRGFFMLGLPSETRDESLATIAFAKKLDPFWAQFTLTVPYPGTKMFSDLDDAGEILTYDWTKYNTWSGWKGEDTLPFVAKGRTLRELIHLQKQALRQFYMRPRVVLRFLRSIRSPYDFKKYIIGFWVLFKSRLSHSS
jgi:radical SAM superfamily enzyme YgiQ (UPF0313 family)